MNEQFAFFQHHIRNMETYSFFNQILTTELIGVKVSWPLATVQGRPAAYHIEHTKLQYGNWIQWQLWKRFKTFLKSHSYREGGQKLKTDKLNTFAVAWIARAVMSRARAYPGESNQWITNLNPARNNSNCVFRQTEN